MIEQKYKVGVVGDSGVGKRSLLKTSGAYYDDFSERCLETVGIKIVRKEISFDNYKVTQLIWDISEKEKFDDLRETHYNGTRAVVIVSDVTNNESIKSMEKWVDSVYEVTGKIPVVFVGNKIDKIEKKKRIGTISKFNNLAKKYNAEYFLTSTDEKINVNEPFEYLAKRLAGEPV